MPLETVVPTCSNCGTELNKIKGKFGMFWGCPNFKECKFKGFSANKERPKDKPETRITETPTRDQILLEEIQAISKRFDDMNEGITKGFKAIKEMLVILQSKNDR